MKIALKKINPPTWPEKREIKTIEYFGGNLLLTSRVNTHFQSGQDKQIKFLIALVVLGIFNTLKLFKKP